MKQIFTFLFCITFVANTFAQLVLENGVSGTLTDLTPAGTKITSVALDKGYLDMSKLVVIKSKSLLVFTANDGGDYGDELYVTDGTVEGTELLKDINPGNNSSSPTSMCAVGNDLVYFAADDGTNGKELWVTDGTKEGTKMVKDINLTGNSNPQFLTEFNGTVLFKAQSSISAALEKSYLWVSDGTENGTYQIEEVEPVPANGQWSYNPLFIAIGDKAIFPGDDGTFGREIWVTDGKTEENTFLVLDINFTYADTSKPSEGTLGQPDMDWGVAINDEQVILRPRPDAFFYKSFGAEYENYVTVHNEPWVTDGTALGTYPLKDIRTQLDANQTGTMNSGFGETVLYNGLLHFRANHNTFKAEWYTTDGTPEGTDLFVNLNGLNAGTDAGGGQMHDYWAIFDGLLFTEGQSQVENDSNHIKVNCGKELFVTDGTLEGTKLFADMAPGALNSVPDNAVNMAVVNEKLYFVADSSGNKDNYELHCAPSATDSTQIFKVFDGPGNSTPNLLTNMDGSLYCVIKVGEADAKLVKYDDGETPKANDEIDITKHYVPRTTYVNPHLADYQAIRDTCVYNPNCDPLAVNDKFIRPLPNIFPNPANEYVELRLQNASMANIVVYNTLGQAVFHKYNVRNNTRIQVSEIASASGLYYIWVNSEEGLVINPVILEIK